MDALNGLLITLFERYSELLLRKFSIDFDQVSCDVSGFAELTPRRSSLMMTTNL